jgi:nucleoside-diphosphate-sugar epimerase
MEPTTVYGISKLAGERWCDYYFRRFGVDVRSIRYPGLISYKTEAGGGTTDYAVEIYYAAVKEKKYECFLKADTKLPMMFMPDAIEATIALMEAPSDEVQFHIGYNISGFSTSPANMAVAIQKHIPEFKLTCKPDFRQTIAESWPNSVDDYYARCHNHWKSKYDLETTTQIMLDELKKKIIL